MTFEGLPITFEKRKYQQHLRLAYRNGTLNVSGPWWIRSNDLVHFLEQHRDWIIRTKSNLILRSEELLGHHGNGIQDVLYLGKAYPVQWQQDLSIPSGSLYLDIHEEQFCFRGDFLMDWNVISDEQYAEVYRLIQKWLRVKAYELLPDRVATFAENHQFNYQKLFIRSQKTKWGTCSSKKNLSLNWKLIQCPEFVIDYLIVHECCHLLEMNHNPAFWNKVAHYYPDYKTAETWLKRYGSVVLSNY